MILRSDKDFTRKFLFFFLCNVIGQNLRRQRKGRQSKKLLSMWQSKIIQERDEIHDNWKNSASPLSRMRPHLFRTATQGSKILADFKLSYEAVKSAHFIDVSWQMPNRISSTTLACSLILLYLLENSIFFCAQKLFFKSIFFFIKILELRFYLISVTLLS